MSLLYSLNFTTFLANSADDKLMIFFLFFPEKRLWHFMQSVSLGYKFAWNITQPIFLEKYFEMSDGICTQHPS